MSLNAAGPLHVVDALRAERTLFVELLRSLNDDDWQHPTECPAYDVQGVAAHLLGDDFSLLSRQRDAATPGLLRVLQPNDDFRVALDRFNDRWVDTVGFFSPALLVELLELSGAMTADWYASVDPHSLGEPVGLFGATGPSPYWQISAREYLERWVHHHQIRRAVGCPNLEDDALVHPAAAAVVRSIAAHLDDLGAQPGASLVVSIDGLASWTLVREGEQWRLFDGHSDEALAELRLDRSLATPALCRGLSSPEVEAAFALQGDLEVARRAVRGIAALAGRPAAPVPGMPSFGDGD